jgi:hypothetical protein
MIFVEGTASGRFDGAPSKPAGIDFTDGVKINTKSIVTRPTWTAAEPVGGASGWGKADLA